MRQHQPGTPDPYGIAEEHVAEYEHTRDVLQHVLDALAPGGRCKARAAAVIWELAGDQAAILNAVSMAAMT